jgi:glycerol uptake facilitator-like aquaporin
MGSAETSAAQRARMMEPVGKAALIASVGGTRGYADWTNPDHRLRRLLAEFIGMAGLTFILSGGAAILARYGGHGLQPWQTVLVLSAVSALWLVVAVYFLGDISAHFNPVTTLAFALRRDMDWVMVGAYWVVQFAAAICGSLLARGFFGPAGHLAATMPKPGQSWQAAGFETIITFGLVLMILNLANGPKLNGPFIPLAVGAYIMGWGTMGGPYEGASMNPARSFGPDTGAARAGPGPGSRRGRGYPAQPDPMRSCERTAGQIGDSGRGPGPDERHLIRNARYQRHRGGWRCTLPVIPGCEVRARNVASARACPTGRCPVASAGNVVGRGRRR